MVINTQKKKKWLLHFYYNKTMVNFHKGCIAMIINLNYSLKIMSSNMILYLTEQWFVYI